jgi:transposase
VATEETLVSLPEDNESLKALLRSLILDQQREKQRAEEQRQRADDLYIENLRLQKELARYKKWYYGPRADRLRSDGELAQALLEFAERLEQRPVPVGEAPPQAGPECELRRIGKRKGRRPIADFENLPVTTHVYELTPERRACPCCGRQRREIGAEESWQIEYVPGRFERLRHVRKKYACPSCEKQGDAPQIEAAAKPEAAIEKGLAGPGLLAYIVTGKFSDYLPLYRLEDIFERQGFEISRATQSVWCGDVAELIEPLYELMAGEMRKSHLVATDETTMPMLPILPMLSPGKTQQARMWVYVGDTDHPYNVFDFTLNRGRDGPARFLKDYNQVLLADAYGGYNGVAASNRMTRAGCWAHARRKFVEAEKAAPEQARDAVASIRLLYAVEKLARDLPVKERLEMRRTRSLPVLAELHRRFLAWKEQLLPKHPMAEAVGYALGQWEELNVFCSDGAVPIGRVEMWRGGLGAAYLFPALSSPVPH